jgi:hypothetical protein
MIPLLLASAVLFVAVALLVVRPLLAPREEVAIPPAAEPAASGPPAVDATDRDAVEALIASHRQRMERHATGAGS